jgi:hypothetical protein
MSPKAGFVLLDQIEPRLRATMPYIRGVGSEDTDDPAMAASRFVDWEEFLDTHNPRYEAMVTDFAQGKRATDTAARFGFSDSWAHDLKDKLAGDLREYFVKTPLQIQLRCHRGGETSWWITKKRRAGQTVAVAEPPSNRNPFPFVGTGFPHS